MYDRCIYVCDMVNTGHDIVINECDRYTYVCDMLAPSVNVAVAVAEVECTSTTPTTPCSAPTVGCTPPVVTTPTRPTTTADVGSVTV